MQESQTPVINRWYTNLTGRLFRVKAYSVDDKGVTDIVIEYPDGNRNIISRHDWFCLNSKLYQPVPGMTPMDRC